MTPQRVHTPEVAPQQYAVVLVDQAQLDQLMKRPGMKQVNRWAPHDVYARYRTLKRRVAAAVVFLLVLATGGFFWFVAPQPALASVFPWSGASMMPTLHTGASFSVTIASLDSADGASVAAAQVRGQGLPAFTRRSPGKRTKYQAMVGPYASLEEAERAQRRMTGLGYGSARLFVDESLRGSARSGRTAMAPSNPALALLGAPDRLSLVFELESEPRQVKTRRTSATSVEVDAGPMAAPAQAQQWSAPGGVHLLQTVAVEAHEAAGELHYLRARLTLPEFAKANVRSEGRRIYVDLTWPLADEDLKMPRRAAASTPSRGDAGVPSVRAAEAVEAPVTALQFDQYRRAIAPVHGRITEIKPFLLSGARAGSPEVLGALDQMLAALEASLTAMRAPGSEAGQHQLLVSATRAARRGLEPGFPGDRVAHVQQAITMFDGAMAPAVGSLVP